MSCPEPLTDAEFVQMASALADRVFHAASDRQLREDLIRNALRAAYGRGHLDGTRFQRTITRSILGLEEPSP